MLLIQCFPGYDLRAAQLTECGDKLKELIREIDHERVAVGGKLAPERLSALKKTYSDVVTDVENHERNDYRFASLEMVNDYLLTGIPRFILLAGAHASRLFSYVLPTALMAIEAVFILDMMSVTKIFTPYLSGAITGA